MSSPKRRIETDVMKLLMSDYDVSLVNDNMQELLVKFNGPEDTPYQNGVWKVRVELPSQYPYKSPSIGFVNRIFHPNIEESSGAVCLDVINQTWTPMYDMMNIFEVFLPQLLRYPNPSDPLNTHAAHLNLHDPAAYKLKVKDYIERFAQPHHAEQVAQSDEESELSSIGDYSDEEIEMEL